MGGRGILRREKQQYLVDGSNVGGKSNGIRDDF